MDGKAPLAEAITYSTVWAVKELVDHLTATQPQRSTKTCY